MAILPSKRLLLVAFILLCFITITVRGRSLRETSTQETRNGAEKSQNDLVKTKNQGGEQPDTDDLVTMDYTPAKKNPPIHN
ncbi:hypothetical protein L6164_025063 [Bauhinia variegata]|uniref:Uncharacterized protein n=1 Tax=Bauhinia variegata TaxID=167791 RepID=A0ACB9LZS2_BAUVA|nr:hypothetical protein L6164_025063 [Bauhinia variegata]